MKKEHTSLFANLFGRQKKAEAPKTTPVVITSYSQPHVLQQRMHENKLKHGDRVTATLSPIRLESNFGKMVMYFYPMVNMDVTDKLEVGDGAPLPAEATIYDVNVPAGLKPGLYTMKNAQLFSNGTLQVIAKEDTVFEPFVDSNSSPALRPWLNPSIPF